MEFKLTMFYVLLCLKKCVRFFIVTERPKHAEEILKKRDLSDFEGQVFIIRNHKKGK